MASDKDPFSAFLGIIATALFPEEAASAKFEARLQEEVARAAANAEHPQSAEQRDMADAVACARISMAVRGFNAVRDHGGSNREALRVMARAADHVPPSDLVNNILASLKNG